MCRTLASEIATRSRDWRGPWDNNWRGREWTDRPMRSRSQGEKAVGFPLCRPTLKPHHIASYNWGLEMGVGG